MRIVSVCSPCNDCGKTTLIDTILKAFPQRWGVLKCTTIYSEEQFCPTDEKECACHNLEGDYCLIDDPEKIRQKDTDTGRFVEGGAVSVYWGVSRPGSHLKLWKLLISSYLEQPVPLLIEGNSLTQELRPDLLLFVVDPEVARSRYKTNTAELASWSDYLIFNSKTGHSSGHGQVGDRLGLKTQLLRQAGLSGFSDAERVLIEDVSQPLRQWQNRSPYAALKSLIDAPL